LRLVAGIVFSDSFEKKNTLHSYKTNVGNISLIGILAAKSCAVMIELITRQPQSPNLSSAE